MRRDVIGQLTYLYDSPTFARGFRSRSARHVAALISSSGAIAERDGAAGARLVRGDAELVRHVTAFLRTGLPEARFLWPLERRTWLWTTLHRDDRAPRGVERALLRGVIDSAPHGLT